MGDTSQDKEEAEKKAKKADDENGIDAVNTSAADDEKEDEKKRKKDDDDTAKSIDYIATLRKAEEQAMAIIRKSDPQVRKEALLAKAGQPNARLSEAEAMELQYFVTGKTMSEPLSDVVNKSFSGRDNLRKGVEGSSFLSELTTSINKSLTAVCDKVQESQDSQRDLNLYTAKGMVALSGVVQKLAKALEDVQSSQHSAASRAPVRGPVSQGVGAPKPVNKSFAGENGGGFTFQQKKGALEQIFAKSKSYQGIDVGRALIGYEVTKSMPQALEEEVHRYLEGRN